MQALTPYSFTVGTSVSTVFHDQESGPSSEVVVGDPAGVGIVKNSDCSSDAAPIEVSPTPSKFVDFVRYAAVNAQRFTVKVA